MDDNQVIWWEKLKSKKKKRKIIEIDIGLQMYMICC